jgi:hypothetical protein
MNDPRMDQWRQRLQAVKSCHSTDEVVRTLGSPDRKVPERGREIWHYPLGVVGGSLYSIHVVAGEGALNEAYMHATPAGDFTPQATPEQKEFVRRRRKRAPIIARTYLAIVLFGFMVLHLSGAERFARKVVAWSFLSGGIGLAIFFAYYWKCPVCGEGFSRQSGGKYCARCKTQFEA